MDIVTEGRWQTDIFGKQCWEVNTSSILTQLIQDAGRWCEHYASDLFIQWSCNIERNLCDRNWKGGTYSFGFREMGVDDDFQIQHNKDYPHYYRKVRELTVEIVDNKICMSLK